MVLYAAIVVPGLVLLIGGDTALGIVLMAAGHFVVWAFGRWYRGKFPA